MYLLNVNMNCLCHPTPHHPIQNVVIIIDVHFRYTQQYCLIGTEEIRCGVSRRAATSGKLRTSPSRATVVPRNPSRRSISPPQLIPVLRCWPSRTGPLWRSCWRWVLFLPIGIFYKLKILFLIGLQNKDKENAAGEDGHWSGRWSGRGSDCNGRGGEYVDRVALWPPGEDLVPWAAE